MSGGPLLSAGLQGTAARTMLLCGILIMAIAYFSTWTTYGTWLPGDERGWFAAGKGIQLPDMIRRLTAALVMTDSAVTLDMPQRLLVEEVIGKHCEIRGWTLHAVQCRSNHVHVVVSANDRAIQVPREQFKSWSTRKLKENAGTDRRQWWSERGWDVYLDDERGVHDAVRYVAEGQDPPRLR